MTGTQWLCTPECWQKGSHTEGCGPIPDDRDKRIAELEAERDRLEYALQTLRLNPLDHPDWPMVEQLIDEALNKADTK